MAESAALLQVRNSPNKMEIVMVEVPTPTNTPKNKVLAATGGAAVGSAISVILIWTIQKAGLEVPANVADALGVITTAILTFVSGWAVPPGAGEVNIAACDGTVASGVMPTPSPATAGGRLGTT